MDAKRSMVTAASRKQFRAVLPRVTDLMSDIVELRDQCQQAETVMLVVCDAEDAFWQVPLHPAERRFFCGIVRRSDGTLRYFGYSVASF